MVPAQLRREVKQTGAFSFDPLVHTFCDRPTYRRSCRPSQYWGSCYFLPSAASSGVWITRPEPATWLFKRVGRLSSRTLPLPEMLMSASSLGAASMLPLPEILTVSCFAATSASRALPEPEMLTESCSTLPWPRSVPLPLMPSSSLGWLRFSILSLPEPDTFTRRKGCPGRVISRSRPLLQRQFSVSLSPSSSICAMTSGGPRRTISLPSPPRKRTVAGTAMSIASPPVQARRRSDADEAPSPHACANAPLRSARL